MTDAGTALDPWRRWGWLVWAGWLVFLGFPFAASLAADQTWQVVLGVACTTAFGAVYVWGVARLTRGTATAFHGPGTAVEVLVLVLVVAVSVPALGLEALAFSPFLVAIGTFGLPRPWCWWFVAAVLATALLVPLGRGDLVEWLYLLLILLAVTGGTVAGRLMGDHGEEVARVGEQLAVTSERERVARDVHDVLGHSLTVVAVKAELAERLLEHDPERARAELAEVQALTRQALAEVRATVGGLRSARLEDELASSHRALTDAGVRVELRGDPSELDPRHRAVAGWVVREAVTNVLRHAGADRCEIGIDKDRLWVADDGTGHAGVPGNGLRGLAERVAASGGTLSSTPAAQGGTRLEVLW